MTPDLSFLIGVARGVLLSLQRMCHVSALRFVDPIRVLHMFLLRTTPPPPPALHERTRAKHREKTYLHNIFYIEVPATDGRSRRR